MKKSSKKVFILGIIGALFFFGFIYYLYNTMGMAGLIKWEKTYKMYYIYLLAAGITGVVLSLLSLTGKKLIKVLTVIYSVVLIVASLAAGYYVYSLGTWEPEHEIKLNYYGSEDAPLSNTKNVSVAVASDSHWGAEASNSEARNRIMDTVNNGEWDLFSVGGDIVEYGYNKSQVLEAIDDMEQHLTKVPVNFVMGNHDVLVNTSANFRRFFQPKEESYNYVLEIAPGVHWVVYNILWDMSDITGDDLNWLDETLSSFDEDDTVIVQSHGFAYGSGYVSEGGGQWWDIPGITENVVPILEKYNVDLMISGHQHSMELMENNGVYYALVGPFGGPLFNHYDTPTKAKQLYYNGDTYGFSSIEIEGNETTISFRDVYGNKLYSHTIKTDK